MAKSRKQTGVQDGHAGLQTPQGKVGVSSSLAEGTRNPGQGL